LIEVGLEAEVPAVDQNDDQSARSVLVALPPTPP
jgi:hypothetical protein